MNRYALERLANNPHYKLSPKQKAELAELTKNPMITIGEPMLHNNEVTTHPSKVVKRKVLKDDGADK